MPFWNKNSSIMTLQRKKSYPTWFQCILGGKQLVPLTLDGWRQMGGLNCYRIKTTVFDLLQLKL